MPGPHESRPDSPAPTKPPGQDPQNDRIQLTLTNLRTPEDLRDLDIDLGQELLELHRPVLAMQGSDRRAVRGVQRGGPVRDVIRARASLES